MKILGIDTSSPKLSIAITDNSRIIGSLSLNLEKGHCSYLIPFLDKLLKKTKISLDKIDVLAVNRGPGSFTGLRIGVTTVKGISLATRKKVVAVPALDILAYNLWNEAAPEYICPVVDAKKNKIYTAIYHKDDARLKKKSKDLLISIEDLVKMINKPTLFLGDAIKLYKKEILEKLWAKASFAREELWFPKAGNVAILAERLAKQGKFADPLDLVPRYLHKRDCQVRL